MAADEKNLNNLISLEEASRISGLSSVHLRHLVATGKLWGKKFARNWVTNKDEVLNYLKQNYHPGRPPKKHL
jgi:hypothetical protein